VSNSFEIKSAVLPLVALLLKTPDMREIAAHLFQQYGPDSDSSDFFDHDPVVLDFSRLEGPLVWGPLEVVLRVLPQCRMKAVAFRGLTSSADATLLLDKGLVEAPPEANRNKAGVNVSSAPQTVEVIKEVLTEVVHEVPGPATMVIDKPVRSGQKIYARGADLVVLAMVNQGGEVVADGNIHVYAPLRGKAMAGASGNTQARIFSLCLEPELISIAGVYRTSENSLAPDIQGRPAQVRLSDDGQEKLLFEALNA